jgi:hypothetical protein
MLLTLHDDGYDEIEHWQKTLGDGTSLNEAAKKAAEGTNTSRGALLRNHLRYRNAMKKTANRQIGKSAK